MTTVALVIGPEVAGAIKLFSDSLSSLYALGFSRQARASEAAIAPRQVAASAASHAAWFQNFIRSLRATSSTG